MSSEDKSAGVLGFLAGAVIGGVVGAGVAMLFTPRTGEETRKLLKKKADDLGNEFQEIKKEIAPKIKKAKKQLSQKFAAATKH
ncbi:MAG: YtxH domain-containing protein [Patescibacteria group bacterium]|nr:YtxH domain-containing protein [Patescibacteria group bacterium]